MRPAWISDVWNTSCGVNILATNERFDRHILPAFYNKRFSSTGLNLSAKSEIKALIENNGGIYSGGFSSRNTQILIMEAASMGTEKHRAAERNKIECLTPDWIRKSAAKGFALPIEEYKIVSAESMETSTPEKTDQANEKFELTNASILSRIAVENDVSINETVLSAAGSPIRPSGTRRANANASYKETFNKLNVQAAKKAGMFLDGCNVSV